MKKETKIILIAIVVLIALFIIIWYYESPGLDEIQDYTVTVNPKDDGSLNIKYHIEWKVLDSTSEGPLEWVRIGVPNQYVDNLRILTDNIREINYSYQGGSYVRIDFKNKYYAGQTVVFEFSLNQKYMYNIKGSYGAKVNYKFTPGWFNEIKVKKATIKWNGKNIISHNGQEDGKYIVWSKSLGKGQKITAKVNYSITSFENIQNNKPINRTISSTNYIVIITIFLVVIMIIRIYIVIFSPSYYWHGGYGYYGGYYPDYYHHHHHHHHGGFGGGRRKFLCLCMRMCRRRQSRLC